MSTSSQLVSSNVAATIDASGAHAPLFPDIVNYFVTEYKLIFGSDSYLTSDSQDFQLINVYAAAINDVNTAILNAYNSFRPTYAQGTGLSSVVQINGIQRLVATNSTATVTIVGQAGAPITNGIVSDTLGNQYTLPSSIVIPLSGSISVLATCTALGSIYSAANTIINIVTPTKGWQSVTNPEASTPGNPIETDAQLRKRQTLSTSYGSTSTVVAIYQKLSNTLGVTDVQIYENNTGTTDTSGSISGAPGLPGHSIAVVVIGGDPITICNTIGNTKDPGCGTYGTTSEIVNVGNTTETINFYVSSTAVVTATITITPKVGYDSSVSSLIKTNFMSYINGLQIGSAYEFAQALAAVVGPTYKTETIVITVNGGSPTTNADVAGTFNSNFKVLMSAITLVD